VKRFFTTMDPKDVYVHTSILARNAHKGGMELHNPLHRGSTREGCANIFLRFFADLMKQALEEGKVEEVPWPQPPSPAISGREEDSETEWEDVEEVDKSGEQKEQPAEDAAGDQCAAPTPASAQALAPATGVSPSLPSTSAQQGANRNPAPRNTRSTSNHLREEDLVQGDLLAVPLEDGSFKLGRLRRFGTFRIGDTQVAVTLGEDASPFGFMRVSNYKVLEYLSVTSDDGIIGGSVVVHDLAEVKSPVSEKVHENRDWQTFGILDFKFCGHEFFYFHHR
jgi:hypothetical protein